MSHAGRRRAALGSLALGVGLLWSVSGAVAQDASPMASAPPASMVPQASAATTVAVTLVDFRLEPATVQVADPTVTFEVTNQGPTPHNLTIRDQAGTILGATADLSEGQAAPLTVTLPGPGTYILFCSLPGHESLGVKGELIVTGPGGSSPAASAAPAASPAATAGY